MGNTLSIKLDKNYISCAGLNDVKERVKDFKTKYTVKDLLRAFCEQVYGQYEIRGDIISNSIEVIEQGCIALGDSTNHYRVTMYVDTGFLEIRRVDFWINQEGEVSNNLWEVSTYQQVRREQV